MTLVTERAYDFRTAAHWAAGARDNLRLDGDALAVPPRLVARTWPGTSRADAGALPAVDARGDLLWLRPRTRELVVPAEHGALEEGPLGGAAPPRAMVAGRTIIWVLAGSALHRYQRSTRQRLTPYRPGPGRRIEAATRDAGDGLWVVEDDGSGQRWLRHVDCWGRSGREPILLDAPGVPVLASTTDGARFVLLDQTANRLTVRDGATGDVAGIFGYAGDRVLLAVDDRIHLLGADVYQALDLADGGVEDHQELPMPRATGTPRALAATGTGLVVSGTGGLARIGSLDGGDRPRRSVFITPALISPVGVRSGWNRAEVDAVLPAGTAIGISWAATDDPWLVQRAGELLAGPATAGRTQELEDLLPWRTGEAVTYRGGDDGPERLAALLSGVAETTLWLRLWLLTPPGRTPPAVSGLRVRYPDTSLLDELPALYREQPGPAAGLRRILAPYEVLFDELDTTLAGLPGRIDPATVPDDWTAYLLSWLGFPPLADLPAGRRRALLARTADILDRRGTRGGLESLLEVVTGGRVTVTDAAGDPAGWFLGAPGSPLGRETVVLAQLPAPARAGTMVAGGTPLGPGCPDPGRMLAERAGVVTVDLDLDPAERPALGPIVDRLLPYFVPAHCRVRVRYTGAGGPRGGRLDAGLRLDTGDARLPDPDSPLGGAGDRLGRWSLPRPVSRPAVLDDAPELRDGPRLQ